MFFTSRPCLHPHRDMFVSLPNWSSEFAPLGAPFPLELRHLLGPLPCLERKVPFYRMYYAVWFRSTVCTMQFGSVLPYVLCSLVPFYRMYHAAWFRSTVCTMQFGSALPYVLCSLVPFYRMYYRVVWFRSTVCTTVQLACETRCFKMSALWRFDFPEGRFDLGF